MTKDECFSEAARLGNIYSNKLRALMDLVDADVPISDYESMDTFLNAEIEMIHAGRDWKEFCLKNVLPFGPNWVVND